jgi:hypothetical protein
VEGTGQDRGDPFARSVGAALVCEACLLAASRLFTLIYVVASEVNLPDKHRSPGSLFLTYFLTSIALVTVLSWAGAQLRRTPEGAWRAARILGRIDLVLAGLLNAALAAWAATKLSSGPGGVEGVAAWVLTALVALVIVAGLLRDLAGRARPTVER